MVCVPNISSGSLSKTDGLLTAVMVSPSYISEGSLSLSRAMFSTWRSPKLRLASFPRTLISFQPL